jgi:hypothetical protein
LSFVLVVVLVWYTLVVVPIADDSTPRGSSGVEPSDAEERGAQTRRGRDFDSRVIAPLSARSEATRAMRAEAESIEEMDWPEIIGDAGDVSA